LLHAHWVFVTKRRGKVFSAAHLKRWSKSAARNAWISTFSWGATIFDCIKLHLHAIFVCRCQRYNNTHAPPDEGESAAKRRTPEFTARYETAGQPDGEAAEPSHARIGEGRIPLRKVGLYNINSV
jgi:hypothetical protein